MLWRGGQETPAAAGLDRHRHHAVIEIGAALQHGHIDFKNIASRKKRTDGSHRCRPSLKQGPETGPLVHLSTRPLYSRVWVLTLMRSPMAQKMGTFTVAPVALSLASFITRL